MKSSHFWLALVGSVVLAQTTRGDALPDVGGSGSAIEQAAELIEQLDAPEFARRQEASRKLTEAGTTLFPEIEKAAQGGSREVASRAIEILRSHFQGGDETTKKAARASLERLAASGNPSAAQRAKDALNPQPEPADAGNLNGINPAMIQLMQQRAIQQQQLMRLQMPGRINPAPGQVVRRTSMRTVNGQREIEEQNGNKITKVRDVPGGGIEGQVTETINGKETTRKVEAKDLDDLKKKDNELAQFYERYSADGGIPRGGMPGLAPADALKRQIDSLDRMIERYKARLPNDPNAQRRIDSYQRLKQQIEQQLKDAEKAAAAPAANPPGE